MVAAESVFQNTTCSCLKHEPLEGSNKYGPRTKQAAEWSAFCNRYEKALLVAQEDEAFPVRPLEARASSNQKDAEDKDGHQRFHQTLLPLLSMSVLMPVVSLYLLATHTLTVTMIMATELNKFKSLTLSSTRVKDRGVMNGCKSTQL